MAEITLPNFPSPPQFNKEDGTYSIFQPMIVSPYKRVFASVQGPEGGGKTYLSFSGPAPVAYINLDGGNWERVKEQFPDKQIDKIDFELPPIPDGSQDDYVSDLYRPIWTRVKHAWQLGLSKYRTVVMDHATAAWQIARLAYLGKLTKVRQQFYDQVNADFLQMLKLADRYNQTNVILIHREKAEYDESGRKTGGAERAGFAAIGNEVRDLYRCYMVIEDGVPQFRTQCLMSKTQYKLSGKVYSQPNNTFVDLAMDLYPGTTPDEWM